LFKKGDFGRGFFFLVEGKIELLVKADGQENFQYSKSID
jgi:hypothetical protein